MKTTFEILQKTIETARKLGALDVKEQKLKNAPIEMPEIKGGGEVAELQMRLASIKTERDRENELHELEVEILMCSEKLNAFLWLFEDSKVGKS